VGEANLGIRGEMLQRRGGGGKSPIQLLTQDGEVAMVAGGKPPSVYRTLRKVSPAFAKTIKVLS
jgi:hypothetical protein